MPMVELSDEDAAALEAVRKMGGLGQLDLAVKARNLHEALYRHKDTAASYQADIKKVFPQATVASDVAAPYVAKLDDGLKKIDDFIESQQKERQEAEAARMQSDFDGQWNGVVKDYGLTEEGQTSLLNFMKQERIANPEAAALLYYKRNPAPPEPVTPSAITPMGWGQSAMGIDGTDDGKLLVSDPDAWADREAAAVLTEIRRAA